MKPSRVVELPRNKAIQLAKYERDSLLLRAKSSLRCPGLWRDAARHADLALEALRRGHDSMAATHALRIALSWKRAADCEGWPTPLGATDISQIVSLSPEQKLDLIIKVQKEEARKRKLTVAIALVGAIIAAAKLGIIAIPIVKAARQKRI